MSRPKLYVFRMDKAHPYYHALTRWRLSLEPRDVPGMSIGFPSWVDAMVGAEMLGGKR